MRLLKIILYLVLVVVLQTVVFARLNILGVAPDLILVSVILFAVFEDKRQALFFAACAGFLQDVLGHGLYLNMVVKLLAALLVSGVKESFSGEEFSLAMFATAVLTPLALLSEGIVYYVLGRQLDLASLGLDMLVATFYNSLLVFVLLPVVRRVRRA